MKRLELHMVCACLLLGFMVTVTAQTPKNYIIGPGDLLSIAFWQDQEMNVTTLVAMDSTIVLSVGGTLRAAGLTADQLAEEIIDRVSLFNRRITSATVTVKEYGSRKVYIMGKVQNPGKYSFSTLPGLWDLLMEAGGPTSDANLGGILLIRTSENGTLAQSIDLADALRRNSVHTLPALLPGDNIYVPEIIGSSVAPGMNAVQNQENVLFIYGQVGTPGVHTFNKTLNLLEALITAGGPTPQARLSQIRVIRKIGAYSTVTHVDVDRYIKGSVPNLFLVQGGDTIFVPRKLTIRESFVWDLFMIAAAAVVTAAVYDTWADR
ncbi:MAG TPA: SLBB domain-containing protein [bacterium]|nr:SLBB domain-containing protein [bacterium]HPG45164.1 SLBB domain-containing protein [bacterium]HPM97406.1 SLBB domain-containing protein [bacterium]